MNLKFTLFSDLFGIGSMISGLVDTAADTAMQAQTNAMNQRNFDAQMEFNRENFEYQKQLQDKIFAREDSAFQRQVEDLRNAGLNTQLAVGGSGAGSGSVVSTGGSSLNPNVNQAAKTNFQNAWQGFAMQHEMELKEESLQIARQDADTREFQAETDRMRATGQNALADSQRGVNRTVQEYNKALTELTQSKTVDQNTRNRYLDAQEQLALELKNSDLAINRLKIDQIKLGLECMEFEKQLKATDLKFAEREKLSKLYTEKAKRFGEYANGINQSYRSLLDTVRTFLRLPTSSPTSNWQP